MKFLNFFKTGLGIFILLVVVATIILISMNWDAIKTWWNTATTPADALGAASQRIANGSVAVYDSNGNYTGDYNVSDANQRKNPCQPGYVIGFNSNTNRFECHPYA